MGPTWAKIQFLYGTHMGPIWASCPDSAHMGPICPCVLGRAIIIKFVYPSQEPATRIEQ